LRFVSYFDILSSVDLSQYLIEETKGGKRKEEEEEKERGGRWDRCSRMFGAKESPLKLHGLKE
jgi:hypothetical protein